MAWDEIKRGAQTVMDESQRLARVMRAKTQIKVLEASLGDLVYDLGTRALDLHRRNELHHHELDEIFVEIKGVQREIREKQAEIDACTAVGKSSRRPPVTQCPECGRPVVDSDRFCRECGADLRRS